MMIKLNRIRVILIDTFHAHNVILSFTNAPSLATQRGVARYEQQFARAQIVHYRRRVAIDTESFQVPPQASGSRHSGRDILT